MPILHQISPHPEVRDWIVAAHGGIVPPSDAAPWSLEQAKQALERLQEMARSSFWGLDLWREERLGHFAIAGMGSELARRLHLPLQPSEQQLLLDIAILIGDVEPLEAAIRLLQDETQDERVRTLAAHFIDQVGTRDDFLPLDRWARSVSISSDDSALPPVVSSLYAHKFWCFEETATFSLDRADTERGWLQYVLSRDLSLDRARWLIQEYLLPNPQRISSALLKAALQMLTEQSQPTTVDCKLAAQLYLQEEVERSFDGTDLNLRTFFQKVPRARRQLFSLGLKTDPEAKKRGSWRWRNILQAEDFDWLLDLPLDKHPAQDLLLQNLYHLAYQGNTTRSNRNRVRNEIRTRSPQMLSHLDKNKERLRRLEKRWQPAQESTEKTPTHELESLVCDTLLTDELGLYEKMRRFSWSCFTRPYLRPTSVRGQWNDLSDNLRRQVLEVCQDALRECTPTAIPEGNSFPSSIIWEASCFHHVLNEAEEFSLTSKGIRSWLPSILRVWEKEWESTLRRCLEIDRLSSEEVFLEAVLREMRKGESSSYLAQELPSDLWSESLAERLIEKILRSQDSKPEFRISILARISRALPELALDTAQSWAAMPVFDDEIKILRDAGIDILLQIEPEEGWTQLKTLLNQEEASQVLVRMYALLPNHFGPDAHFSTWPSVLLGELTELLYRTFPLAADPIREHGVAYSLDAKDDLRSLRARLPKLLFQRNQPGDARILEQLAEALPEIRSWLDHARAQQGAEGVLTGIGRENLPHAVSEGIVPLPQMVRLLLDERYRLLRTAADLQAVVLEELSAIAKDTKEYLALLYRPSKKRGKPRGRLHEEALQAYICCRLRDRLVPVVLNVQRTSVFIDREPLAAQNQRNDVKIQTESVEGKPLKVIIEVKWSDNVEISTSQTEQLAKNYLLNVGLTHGIYLVGWCGKFSSWRNDALGDPPSDRSNLHAWQEALDKQAACLEQQFQVNVQPVIFDLVWETEQSRQGSAVDSPQVPGSMQDAALHSPSDENL